MTIMVEPRAKLGTVGKIALVAVPLLVDARCRRLVCGPRLDCAERTADAGDAATWP